MRCCGWAAGAVAISLLWVGSARAQEVVHALSGTVTKVDPQGRTIQVTTNDGSNGTFNFPPKASNVEIDFDRNVKDRTTPVSTFNKPKEEVVLYFYGGNSVRTAVAVQDLGPGPFVTVEGTVTNFNKHQHQISVKDSAGKEQTFDIDAKAMADTPNGAVPADKCSPSKGDNVRVIATKANGGTKALFIRD